MIIKERYILRVSADFLRGWTRKSRYNRAYTGSETGNQGTGPYREQRSSYDFASGH